MKGFPVIYTRTFFNDFHFCTLPDFVDAQTLSDYINAATNNLYSIEDCSKVRLIYANESYCVIGCTSYLKQLADIDSDILMYCHDEKGRSIYGFWGVAIKKEPFGSIPVISDEIWADIYKKYVIPIWDAKLPDTNAPEPISLNTVPYTETYAPEYKTIDDKHYLFAEDNSFEWVMYRVLCSGDEISYCSRLDEYTSVKRLLFTYTVTNEECFYRLKEEYDERIDREQRYRAYRENAAKNEPEKSWLKKWLNRFIKRRK